MRFVLFAIAGVACVGLLREATIHFVVEAREAREDPPLPIDARYAGVRTRLPAPGGRLGWLSDEGPTASRRFIYASYALTPHLLVDGDRAAPFVLVDVREAAKLDALLALPGYTVAFRGEDLALLARTEPR